MFATEIECSYPTIEHGRWRRRRDAFDAPLFALWQHDFELARETGITHITLRSAAAPDLRGDLPVRLGD